MKLHDLRFISVLNHMPERKLAFILAAPKSNPAERAIVVLEKFDFDVGRFQDVFDHASEVSVTDETEVVKDVTITVPGELNRMKAFIQLNVTPKDIAKMTGAPFRIFRETPSMYSSIAAPFIRSEIDRGQNAWIDRILGVNHAAEHSQSASPYQYASTLGPASLALLEDRRKMLLRISRVNLAEQLDKKRHPTHAPVHLNHQHRHHLDGSGMVLPPVEQFSSFLSSNCISTLAPPSDDGTSASGNHHSHPHSQYHSSNAHALSSGEVRGKPPKAPGTIDIQVSIPSDSNRHGTVQTIPMMHPDVQVIASPNLASSSNEASPRPSSDPSSNSEEPILVSPERKVPNLIYSDDLIVIVPDAKWDRTNIDQIYLLALSRSHIACLRELRGSHVPLLEHIRETTYRVLRNMFHVERHCLRLFFHYLPSYFHMHLHIVNASYSPKGIEVGKAHLLDDVIDNLVMDPDFYAKKAITVWFRETHPLFPAYLRVEQEGLLEEDEE